MEFGDLTAKTTERGFRAVHGVSSGEEFVAEIRVALFGRPHELSQPIDLGTKDSWVVVGRVPRHRR